MKQSIKCLLFSWVISVTLLTVSCSSNEPKTQSQKIEQLEMQQDSAPDYRKAAEINAKLGILYTERNMLDLAKIKILNAQKLKKIPIVYTAFGVYYARTGQTKRAESAFKKSLSMDGDDAQTLTYYAAFLCDNDRFMQSKQLYTKAINEVENTQLGQTYLYYAACQQSQDHVDQAQKLYLKAIEQNPSLTTAYLALAQIYVNKEQYQKADNMLEKYSEIGAQTKRYLQLEVAVAKGLDEPNREATARLILNSVY